MVRKHRGYSIVSILVALAISLFLLAGVLSVYLSSKDTFNYQTALAATSENARFAIDDLRRALFMTGRGLLANESPFGTYGSGTLYDGGSGTGGDILTVIYAGGYDCQGNPVTTKSQQTFFVENDSQGNSALKCMIDGNASTKEPLVSGIEWMQVLYGVNDDGDDYPNRYIPASQVNSEGVWDNVVSLRIGLVVSSGEFTIPQSARKIMPTGTQLPVLDQTFTIADDSRLYRTITTTIPLRNLTITER